MADTSDRPTREQAPSARPDQHSPESGCFFCATDAELRAGLAGRELPRTLHMNLPIEACPHIEEADRG